METQMQQLATTTSTIRLLEDALEWNAWNTLNGASFLQSWSWGEILKAEGKEVERIQVVEDGKVVLQVQVMYYNLPFGWKYAFCAKGPVVSAAWRVESSGEIENVLKKYFLQNGCIFLRIEPLLATTYSLLTKSLDINPRATTVLDLTKSEPELLAAMHEKTRYNIRLAERKGLQVEWGKNFEVFWKLSIETGKRDRFRLHHKEHYEKIFASDFSKQLTVYMGETPLATGVFVAFGDTFTYLYGASEYENRKLMAPYLVQWTAIKEAKRHGFAYYDFFGIAPKKEADLYTYEYDTNHQYSGVTRFKLGFGGEVKEDPGTYDLILSAGKYKMYTALRRLRRLI